MLHDILLVLIGLIVGAVAGFFIARKIMTDYMKKNPELVAGVLKLSSINMYKSAGYGCIEQTDPLLALAMGLSRDSSRATPKLLADKTLEAINDLK